jgi:redox-sensitive bicupin YhaK (pirin superfamily)
MMEPRYRGITAKEIPHVEEKDGTVVRVICGRYGHAIGPARDIVTEPEYLDVSLPKGGTFTRQIPSGHTVFAYVVSGQAYFDRCPDPYAHEATSAGWWDITRPSQPHKRSLVFYGREGSEVEIRAPEAAVRFLLISGKPLNEPVAWYGPIVMNTVEELKTAFSEYARGTFIKKGQYSPA